MMEFQDKSQTQPPLQNTCTAQTLCPDYPGHENTIQAAGFFYCMIAVVFSMLPGLVMIVSPIFTHRDLSIATVAIGFVFVIIGAIQFTLGYGMRTLGRWVKIPVIVLSSIGLLQFPFGSMFYAYFIYLMVSEKGKHLFSDNYTAPTIPVETLQFKSLILWISLIIHILMPAVILMIIPRLLPDAQCFFTFSLLYLALRTAILL